MKNELLMDFSVDKESNTIKVRREFLASLKLVWAAWTEKELLDQWWGPKPWRAETKSMDFREGGHWLYAMISPEGEKHWSMSKYLTIETEKYFKTKGGFSDENGILDPDSPQDTFECKFNPEGVHTLVTITLTFDTLEDLEATIKMGFKEGFTTGLNQLDELLIRISK